MTRKVLQAKQGEEMLEQRTRAKRTRKELIVIVVESVLLSLRSNLRSSSHLTFSSCDPWEKFRRKTSAPERNNFSIISNVFDAGPRVASCGEEKGKRGVSILGCRCGRDGIQTCFVLLRQRWVSFGGCAIPGGIRVSIGSAATLTFVKVLNCLGRRMVWREV